MSLSRVQLQHSTIDDLRALLCLTLQPSLVCPPHPDNLADASRLVNEFFRHPTTSSSPTSFFFSYARVSFYHLLKSFGFPPGSVIALTPITISPILDVIVELGFTPVFVDIELDSFGPCPQSLEAVCKKSKPSLFLLTYLFGFVPDLQPVISVLHKYDTLLVEDISHNIGSEYKGKKLGTFGIASFYSSSLSKFVDSYGGAFLFTSSKVLASEIATVQASLNPPRPTRIVRLFARTMFWNLLLSPFTFALFTMPALKLLAHISPSSVQALLGPSITPHASHGLLPSFYHESISSFQLLFFSRRFSHLSRVLSRRRRLVKTLYPLLQSFGVRIALEHQLATEEVLPVFWQVPIRVESLPALQKKLFKNSIETGPTKLPYLPGDPLACPAAYSLVSEYILVPMSSHASLSLYSKFARLVTSRG